MNEITRQVHLDHVHLGAVGRDLAAPSKRDVPRTVVELVDTHPRSDAPAHRTREVRINGQAVLVETNSLVIDYGDGEATKVMLTILPTEVRFNHDPKEG